MPLYGRATQKRADAAVSSNYSTSRSGTKDLRRVVELAYDRYFTELDWNELPQESHLTALVDAVVDENSLTLSAADRDRAHEKLRAELFGLGPLEPLLATENLTDIFVNSPDEVWVEAGGKISKTPVKFANDAAVRALATRLIVSSGGRLDDSCPSADIQNERGQRIHAVLPPLSRGVTALSIRLQPAKRPSLSQLGDWGMYSAELKPLLHYLVYGHKNFLISGGTGTGKTTLLNAMLGECDSGERIVTIEDSAELAPDHPHVVALQTRQANAEGRGEVGLRELIRQALRMRPSRLVLGECRGEEVADLLTAMNTGHSGTGATVHANSAHAVVPRLYAMGAMAGLSRQAVSLQVSTAIDCVVHIQRYGSRRRIVEFARIVLTDSGLETETLGGVQPGSDSWAWTEAGRRLAGQIGWG